MTCCYCWLINNDSAIFRFVIWLSGYITQEFSKSIRCPRFWWNLLNRLFLERPSRPKLQLASQKIVYVGIKYYYNKSVKFAQRLAKIINHHYGVVKVVPYYKQVESYSHIFQTKFRIRCKTHPLVCTRFRARTATLHSLVKLGNHWESDWNNTNRTAGITLILVRSWIIIN